MPKPTIEFTHVSQFASTSSGDGAASVRVLSEDASTGDKTLILSHPPSQEWGGSGGPASEAIHDYWEVRRIDRLVN